MSVLVTGGAGYIGSHMVHLLLEIGEDVVVVDNLSTGQRQAVPAGATFREGDAGDRVLVSELIAAHGVDAIMHFAGSIVVPESIERPLDYYRNNSAVSLSLIDVAVRNGVENFVFSSSASVYGAGDTAAVRETAVTNPMNPYGRSKLVTEWMLEDAAAAHGLRYAALRYFNVAGAGPLGRAGRSAVLATHLIKRANQVALGKLPCLDVFGTDYETADGTCVRDFIHVSDLVDIHAHTLDYLRRGGESVVLNCGYGHGASVRDVIAAVERVSGKRLRIKDAPRRAGDPPALVANVSRLKALLQWEPRFDDLDEIVRSSHAWEKKLTRPQRIPSGRTGAPYLGAHT